MIRGALALQAQRELLEAETGQCGAVEVIVINDIAARTNAMMSGQVHAINRVDFKTVDLLKRNPRLQVVQSPAGSISPS